MELEAKFKKSQMNNTYEFPRNKIHSSSLTSKTPTSISSNVVAQAPVQIKESVGEKHSASPASRTLDKRGILIKQDQ